MFAMSKTTAVKTSLLTATLLIGLLTGPATANAAATTHAESADTVTGFARDGFRPQSAPETALPYNDAALAPRVDSFPHDAQGVRLFRYNGVTYDHPVVQAQWGLSNLRTYLATQDSFFLDRALAQAQRNLDRKVESRGAWWYPYGFDYPRCAQRTGMVAPWYSAMAQGQLLSLFVRLSQVTGDPKWRTAADRTFASLLVTPAANAPWASWVDADGHLWLEEYPVSAAVTGERVLNGHIFAIYGVYDYWRLTADAQALALFDGATTTLHHRVPVDFRVPDWISRYSVGCPGAYANYHALHAQQMLKIYTLTRAPVFAGLADLFRSDYPAPAVSGLVSFSGGTHIGYTFDATGTMVQRRTLTLSRDSAANADQRVRVYGRGVYYRITDGTLAGFLVPESPGERVLRGPVVAHTHTPQRLLTFNAGTYTGYRYDSSWTVATSATFTFSRPSAAPFTISAWVNGRLSYLITAGAYSGMWVPAGPGLVPA
ncbi:D-glucuronyl C5-epimerase family protein [Micromonospora tulbaghiae]|uniref:D-glucuronyl C5-epimerase family protein n=1 Tax=Micromonospora tulbaghiae TaxID=479978 RepID=UPI0033BD9562